jgi:hypothetical protein
MGAQICNTTDNSNINSLYIRNAILSYRRCKHNSTNILKLPQDIIQHIADAHMRHIDRAYLRGTCRQFYNDIKRIDIGYIDNIYGFCEIDNLTRLQNVYITNNMKLFMATLVIDKYVPSEIYMAIRGLHCIDIYCSKNTLNDSILNELYDYIKEIPIVHILSSNFICNDVLVTTGSMISSLYLSDTHIMGSGKLPFSKYLKKLNFYFSSYVDNKYINSGLLQSINRGNNIEDLCCATGDTSLFHNVDIINNKSLIRINLSDLPYLRTITIQHCACNIYMGMFKKLHTVNIHSCDNIYDICELENIHTLRLTYCRNITNVDKLCNIHTLVLRGCMGVTNVKSLSTVTILDLYDTSVRNISTLIRILPNGDHQSNIKCLTFGGTYMNRSDISPILGYIPELIIYKINARLLRKIINYGNVKKITVYICGIKNVPVRTDLELMIYTMICPDMYGPRAYLNDYSYTFENINVHSCGDNMYVSFYLIYLIFDVFF